MARREDPENPYFRLPISFDPDKFYGSQKKVRLVVQTVADRYPGVLELLGLPGMGITTLLRYLADPRGALVKHTEWIPEAFRKEPERLFPVLVEFRLLPTGMHPFAYLFLRFQEEVAAYQKRVQKVHLTEFPQRPIPEKAESATDILEGDLRVFHQQHIRPVLLLDDFDLAFEKMTLDQTTRMRPWRDRVSIVLGTERPLHQVNSKAAGSPFFQTLPLIRFGGLNAEESLRLIDEPARSAGKGFPAGDIKFVLEQADGHPYLLILAGKALWDLRRQFELLDREDVPLSREQLAILRGRLQEEFQHTFQLYWDRLDRYEQRALKTLSTGGTENLKEQDYMALASLEQKGVVQLNPSGSYCAFSSLFKDFVAGLSEATGAAPKLDLTGLEESLYEYLRAHSERVCTFEELSQAIWGGREEEDEEQLKRRIQVTISRLRKKLQSMNGEDIIALRGQGYRLISP